MVVAQRLAFLFAVSASAVEQPLLLCSPGGRDGFGSQYFHHIDCCTPMPSWSCECRLPPTA